MKYIAVVEQSATQSAPYDETITFTAKDLDELEDLLDIYEVHNEGPGIVVDDSKKPNGFDYSGGFASRLISFKDENGTDISHIAEQRGTW